MNQARLALTSITGTGADHVDAACRIADEELAEIVAYVGDGDDSPQAARLESYGAIRYASLDDLFRGEADINALCLAMPPTTQATIAAQAMAKGIHLFIEPPVALAIQDLRRVLEDEEECGCVCALNAPLIARPELVALKNRLCDGELGAVRLVQAHIRLAGRPQSDSGSPLASLQRIVSPLLDAAAYLAAENPHDYAMPVAVQGEVYGPENAGPTTCCLRARMDSGADVCVHATLAAQRDHPAVCRVAGEKGVADYTVEIAPAESGGLYTARIMERWVEVVAGVDEPLLMPLDGAEGGLLLFDGMCESAGKAAAISAGDLDDRGAIRFIDDVILAAAKSGQLLSETGVTWGKPTKPCDLRSYTHFPEQWSA